MKPKPWVLDGFKFFDEETDKYIYRNARIDEYLEIGNHESRFFLIGSKGLGKTLLLRYKSYLYHKHLGDAYKFNTSITELTDNLDINYNTFSRDELIHFQNHDHWEKIWSLTLWIIVFKVYGLQIPNELNRLINGATKITPIFSYLLAERHQVSRFTDFRNQLLARNHEIQSGVALFIDDVDQSFERILRDDHYKEWSVAEQDHPSVKIWVSAQMGLVAAIYSIYRQNSHVKIFANIRREPWEVFEGALKANYSNHATFLEYEKFEILQILEKNIDMMERKQYVLPNNADPIKKFIGFDEIPHRFALKPEGSPRIENVFDFIYRHTFGRPREIVLMGREICFKTSNGGYRQKPLEEKIIEIRSVVNIWSLELFKRYRDEIIPAFNEEQLNRFIKKLRMNVITPEDLDLLPQNLLNKYFSFGLLGRAVHHSISPEGEEIYRQTFLPPATYNYTKIEQLPVADYYFTHPCLDSLLIQHLRFLKAYNKTNVIGQGYIFEHLREDKVIKNDSISEYFPLKVSGNRWDHASLSYRHAYSLESYYKAFFGDFDNPYIVKRFHEDVEKAKEVFILVSRYCYCYRLGKAFGAPYTDYLKSISDDLSRLGIVRQYGTSLKEVNHKSLLDFKNKLFGRLLTLYFYLFNDLKIPSIHRLLMEAEIDFHPYYKGDSPDRYIQRSFFIYGLRHTQDTAAGKSQRHYNKQEIFDALSPFEQRELRQGLSSVLEEMVNYPLFEKVEHQEWLDDEVLSKVWRPGS